MSYLLLLAFFFTDYVRPTSYVPALTALHINSLVPLGAFLHTLVRSGQASMERILAASNTRIILWFLGLVTFSIVAADVQERAFNVWQIVLGYVFIYWVIASEVTTLARVRGVVQALVAVHLIVAALNPVMFTDPGTRHYIDSGAFLGDGNDFALSVCIAIPLCLFLFLDSKRFLAKLLWAGALLVCVACVILSQSRGGTLGLACMGFYYWTKSRKKIQTALIAAVVVGLILAYAPSSYFDRMNTIGDTQEGSAQGRLQAWRVSMAMALDNPLFGVGAGHFGIKFANEYKPADYIGAGMTAHSIYFLALGELGVPGFLMLVTFILSNLSKNRHLAREVRERGSPTADRDLQLLASLSASVIAFATAGAFLSAIYYPHIFVMAGMMTATRHLVRERTASGETAAPVNAREPQVSVHWALRRPAPAWNTRPEDQPALASGAGLARPPARSRLR